MTPGEEPRESNERLEFLGDSVLGLVCSEWLYRIRPDEHEGLLTKTKSLLVSKAILSRRALAMGLGRFVLLSHSEVESGGRQRLSILADAFEAVIGAIYLDQGLEAARQFIQTWLLNEAGEIAADKRHTNYKSLLQEYVQSTFHTHPVYRIRHEHGPDHLKQFTVEVMVGSRTLGDGRGRNKKEAEQSAARNALERVAAEAARRDEGRRRTRAGGPAGGAREGREGRERGERDGRDRPEREGRERRPRREEREALRGEREERPRREEREGLRGEPEERPRRREEREGPRVEREERPRRGRVRVEREERPEPAAEGVREDGREEPREERREERRDDRRRGRRTREERGSESPVPEPAFPEAAGGLFAPIESAVLPEERLEPAVSQVEETLPQAEATYGRKGKPNQRAARRPVGSIAPAVGAAEPAAVAEAPAGTPTRRGPIPIGDLLDAPLPVPDVRIVETSGPAPAGAPEDRYRVAESDAPSRPLRRGDRPEPEGRGDPEP